MQDAVLKLVQDHIAVANQYEEVGDADSAAKLRAVANMVAALLNGKDAGTILPPLNATNREAIRAKAHEFLTAEKAFTRAKGEQYEDFDSQLAYEEGARRVIDTIVRKPQDAPLDPFVRGMRDAVAFMESE